MTTDITILFILVIAGCTLGSYAFFKVREMRQQIDSLVDFCQEIAEVVNTNSEATSSAFNQLLEQLEEYDDEEETKHNIKF